MSVDLYMGLGVEIKSDFRRGNLSQTKCGVRESELCAIVPQTSFTLPNLGRREYLRVGCASLVVAPEVLE